jgi:hypothetical protein
MEDWRGQLKSDPIPPLLAAGDAALSYFVRRDLLGEHVGPIETAWSLPAVQRILKKQRPDGAWTRPGAQKHAAINHALIETWRQFRFLVEQFGCTSEHLRTRQAAEFLFSCQSAEGDIRGILANQYATYYTGAIMALLIQAGYADDPRIEKGFQWLLGMRQSDGGWSIPMITHKLDRATQYRLASEIVEPLQPDRSKPFSCQATGMVLRAFAAHPAYKDSAAAHDAGRLLMARFFQPDNYTSYHAASYWVRFEYPFWWNNLLSALDSLSRMGVPREEPAVRRALDWFREAQQADGLWRVSYIAPAEQDKKNPATRAMRRWVTFAICRVFSRLYACSGKRTASPVALD